MPPTATAGRTSRAKERTAVNTQSTQAQTQPPQVPAVHPNVDMRLEPNKVYTNRAINIAVGALAAYAVVAAASGIARIAMGWWKPGAGVAPKL